MPRIEQQDIDPAIGYRAVLSRALFGIDHCPRLSLRENTKYGEAIVRLRTELGKFGDVDAFDDGSQPVPPQAACLFEQYRNHANALAEGNIRLIYTAFRVTPTIWDLPHEDLMDLAGTAQEELLRSAKRFNPWHYLRPDDVPYESRFPVPFSSYAVGNMHFRMLRAAKDFQNMHIPDWRWAQYRAYWDARAFYARQQEPVDFPTLVAAAEFKRANQRFPTLEELQAHNEQVNRSDDMRKQYRKQMKSYAKLLCLMHPVSIEEMLMGIKQYRNDDTGEIEIGELFNDDSLPSADAVPEEVFREITREIVTQVLDRVWPRVDSKTRQILEMRFGLLDGTEYTLQQIGDYFNLTRAGILVDQNTALRKLRHPSIKKLLWDLLA